MPLKWRYLINQRSVTRSTGSVQLVNKLYEVNKVNMYALFHLQILHNNMFESLSSMLLVRNNKLHFINFNSIIEENENIGYILA